MITEETTTNSNQINEEQHRLQKIRLVNEIMRSFYALATVADPYEKDFITRGIRFNFEFLGRIECNHLKTQLEKEMQASKEVKKDEEISKTE